MCNNYKGTMHKYVTIPVTRPVIFNVYVFQAVVSSPFSGGAAGVDAGSDATFAYIPAGTVSAGGDNEAVAVTNLASSAGKISL